MWKKIGRYIVFCIVFLSGFLGTAMAAPKVSILLDRKEVLLGDNIILTIKVEDATDSTAPEIQQFPGFKVKFRGVRQESFSSYSVVINGKKIEQSSSGGGYNYDYELTPLKAGVLNIPAFNIKVGQNTFRTQPEQIKVLEKSAKSDGIFLKIQADKKEVYLGEKILITFKWYLNKDINDYKLNVPWLEGLRNFLVADPERDKNTKYKRLIVNDNQQVAATRTREIYKGRQYTVFSFKKILTPISVGEYSLDPSFIKCNVVTGFKRSGGGSGSPFDEFFGRRNAVTESFSVRSKPVEIAVREVPDTSKPNSYNGAVGNFNFTVDLKPTSLKVGEPITVTMKVSGSGNVEQLKLPEFPSLDNFKSYEPESKVNVKQQGGEITGSKIFEKVLIPRSKGNYKIPRISFTFFNPKKKQYQTIRRGPFNIHVEKGDEVSEVKVIALRQDDSNRDQKKKVKILKKDINYIKTSLGSENNSGKTVYNSRWVWFFGYVFPVLMLSGVYFLRRRQLMFQTDIGFARNRNALRNVRIFLRDAQTYLETENTKGFYDALSKGMNSYIGDKLNRPAASITSAVINELEDCGISSVTVENLSALYQRFEVVLFSSVTIETEQLKKDYEDAEGLISELEKVLK